MWIVFLSYFMLNHWKFHLSGIYSLILSNSFHWLMFSRNYLPKILSVGLGWVIYENVVFNGVVNRFRLFTKSYSALQWSLQKKMKAIFCILLSKIQSTLQIYHILIMSMSIDSYQLLLTWNLLSSKDIVYWHQFSYHWGIWSNIFKKYQ